jgi:CBS domain-containing protein
VSTHALAVPVPRAIALQFFDPGVVGAEGSSVTVRGQQPIAELRVRDVMTHDVRTLERNQSLAIADEIMAMERIRHLPVVDADGRLAGIVSQRDLYLNALVRALGYGSLAKDRALQGVKVKEVMTADPWTARPDDLVADAARSMVERKIGCLPVVEGDALVGLVSETDLIRLLMRPATPDPRDG